MKNKTCFILFSILLLSSIVFAECINPPCTCYDLTSDGRVNLFDLVFVSVRLGNPAGDSADVLGNDGVNLQDLQEVAKQFGQKCSLNCVLPEILCGTSCITPVCSSNAECDDSNSSTIDSCLNAETCTASCTHTIEPPIGDFNKIYLKQLPYTVENIELLKSALFFNATNSTTENIFFSQFPNNKVSRTSLFEYYLGESTDTSSFINGLNQAKPTLQKLADRSNALVVVIAKMPLWLSSSQDTGPVSSGNWRVYNTHSPKDYALWKDAVKAGVDWFKQFNKLIYYEVWNEPDFDFFWSEDTNSFLRLYKETALAVKEADATAKIGGTAVNGWDGKIDSSSEPANIELIRFAKKESLPLDFISWHYFSTRSQDFNLAKQTFKTELQAQGILQNQEFLITEWNNPQAVRVSNLAPVILADTFIMLYASDINSHTYSAFQDFGTVLDNSDYGLVRKSGALKPVFYVFKAFDAMAQNSLGVYFSLSASKVQRTLVSKKANNCFDILFWDLDSLKLESREAKTFKLEFDGLILSASGFSVKDSYQQKQPLVSGNRLTFNTELNSFNGLEVCLQ